MKMTVFGRVLLALCCLCAGVAQAESLRIGTYYFPGWKPGQVGSAYAVPWDTIKPFPEREPMLGWYAEDAPGVMTQQLKWMSQHGLRYVAFNWYWSRDGVPVLAHALNSYLTAKDRFGVDFAISWSNHTEYNFSRQQLAAMFRFWANRYFFRDDYLKVDGKPVVFIFSAQVFNRNARAIGLTSSQLIEIINASAREAGLPGVIVIGGVGGNAGGGFDYSSFSGYGGFSAYNFHGPATKRFQDGRHYSHSYKELDISYRDHWEWMLNNSSGLYIVPMTSGWDKRPWGGSKDPNHDESLSTPREFLLHIQAARDVIKAHGKRTRGLGVICCWNEFGEGSFIEPTKIGGFSYLEKVRSVFGERSP